MLQDGEGLLPGNAFELLQELVQSEPVFQICKEGVHRNTGVPEAGYSTHAGRIGPNRGVDLIHDEMTIKACVVSINGKELLSPTE